MAKQPPGYPPSTPKYMNDFTKALASEVRILLAEVGKLRDERRQLQYEIAELMAVKSKHGGDFAPEWRPKIEAPPAVAPPPPPPPAIEDEPTQARPGWRVVQKRPERRAIKGKQPAPAPPPVPVPPPQIAEPPRQELPAWAQWRPNPLLAPTPLSAPASPAPPPGLFGPPSPPPK